MSGPFDGIHPAIFSKIYAGKFHFPSKFKKCGHKALASEIKKC
jgi:hypothetical protein